MSGRIRIVCKRPASPAGASYVRMPSHVDCVVSLVDADGVERAIEGVTRVDWSVEAGKVTEARLVVVGVELDADGMLEHAEPTPCPECEGLGRFAPGRGGTADPLQPACEICKGSGWVVIRACTSPGEEPIGFTETGKPVYGG